MPKQPINKLDQWRIENDLTFDDLATRLGVSSVSAYRICKNKQGVSGATIIAIEKITDGLLTGMTFNQSPDTITPAIHSDILTREGTS